MDTILRPVAPEDAAECGRILYEAFKAIAEKHGFPPDSQSPDEAAGFLGMLIAHPKFYGVVAERAGRIIGSNFVDERSPVLGVGPITVDPAAQNAGVGRRLMQDALGRVTAKQASGVRLIQSAYHNRSLCLYTTLGFRTREPISCVKGPPLGRSVPGHTTRPAGPADLVACNALCRDAHGFERADDLREAIEAGKAMVVEHLGEISGYSTGVGFPGHSVARTNRDLMALIATATEFPGPGFLVPTRNHELLAWCFGNGLKLVQQMTLMTIGLYNEPEGAHLMSIWF